MKYSNAMANGFPIVVFMGALVMGAVGCTPSLRQTMLVPEVPVNESATSGATVVNSYVSIEEFEDGRPSPVLAEGGGKESMAATSVGIAVEDGIARALERKGFVISDSAPTIISGKVLEWRAYVKSGLPSTVNSQAKIAIDVLDPASKKIYSGTYEGNASRQEPGLQEVEIRQNLGVAMSEAVAQIIRDEKLMQLLTSF